MTQLDEEKIAAYVAGELSPGERAEVEALLDQRPEWLAVVACMARAGARTAAEVAPEEPSDPDHLAEIAASVHLSPGTSVGRFVIQGRIAAGGMGVVYAAEDRTLRRSVAIKLARHRPRDAAARERLLREARALAQLSHPGIVVVHDAGEHEGRIYLAMERLEGPTLAEHLRRQPLGVAEIVGLFVQAARGLDAAHRKGIIHRDFKPQNAIVEGARVVVIDFGLAAAAASAPEPGEARPGERAVTVSTIAGTPAYMSPEQCSGGHVSSASDQYSLAVALHEALTGALPGAAVEPARRSGGARPPRALERALRRALAPDPGDRFADLAALATALERAVTPIYRRVAPLIGAGAAVLTLAFVAGAALRGPPVVDRCATAEDGLAEVWSEARAGALQRRYRGLGAAYLGDLGERVSAALDRRADAWRGARAAACREHQGGARSSEALDLQMICLDGQRARMAAMIDALAGADASIADHALEAIAELPRPELCADVTRLREQAPVADDPAARAEASRIADALTRVAVLHRARRLDDALPLAEAEVAAALRLDHWPTIASARAELAWIRSTAGDHDEALAELERALVAAERGRSDRLTALTWIRRIWIEGHEAARHDAGRRAAEHADAWLTRLGDPPDLRFDYHQHLGWLEHGAGAPEAAIASFERALHAAAAAGFGPREAALADNGRGAATLAAGDLDGAAEHFDRAASGLAAGLGPDHPDVAKIRNNLAGLRRALGDLDGAERLFEANLRAFRGAYGDDHELVGQTELNLAVLALDQGRDELALARADRAAAILERALGGDHPMVPRALGSRADALTHLGRVDEAIVVYRDVLARSRRALGDDHPDLAIVLHNLGVALEQVEDHAGAIAMHGEAKAVIEARLGDEHPHLGPILTNLAISEDALGRREDARVHLERAAQVADPLYEAEALTRLGEHLLGDGEVDDALARLEAAHALQLEHPGDRSLAAQTEQVRARARWQRGRGEDRAEARRIAAAAAAEFRALDEVDKAEEVEAWLAGLGR